LWYTPPWPNSKGGNAIARNVRYLLTLVLALTALVGRAGDGAINPAVAQTTASILSVYYGLDRAFPAANGWCGQIVIGQDAVPVTFSVQIDSASLAPEDFAVETTTGAFVTPECATLEPAVEPLERRTILLVGDFGTPQFVAVEVVDTLKDVDGNDLTGLRSEDVTPLAAGPFLVLAERYLPDNPGLDGECPPGTAQVVQLVWSGGVTAPGNNPLGEAQRLAVHVRLENGSIVEPSALRDDGDTDNFVYACIDSVSPAVEVSVDPGFFADPGNDNNPATSATVVDGIVPVDQATWGSVKAIYR
jgi:hypothetical protein